MPEAAQLCGDAVPAPRQPLAALAALGASALPGHLVRPHNQSGRKILMMPRGHALSCTCEGRGKAATHAPPALKNETTAARAVSPSRKLSQTSLFSTPLQYSLSTEPVLPLPPV